MNTNKGSCISKNALFIFVVLLVVVSGSFAIRWCVLKMQIRKIEEMLYNPSQETQAQNELKMFIEQHPYYEDAVDMAIGEFWLDKEYRISIIEKYLEGLPNDLGMRFVLALALKNPREALSHVDFILEQASPKDKYYPVYFHLRKELLADIVEDSTQLLSEQKIDPAS